MPWEHVCPKCRGPIALNGSGFPFCDVCKQAQQPWGDKDNPKVAAVIAVLQDWFEALEEGRAGSRSPDPRYKRRGGKPEWTDAEINQVIATIDYEIHHELSQRPNYWGDRGFNAPSDFDRLGPAQRRALVQDLDRALAKFDGVPRLPEEPIAYG